MNRFLHVGCGSSRKADTPFQGDDTWAEVTVDIDKANRPDILGTITDMSAVETGSFDALFSSHNIEHVEAHQVPQALKEFRRVLKPTGFALITCPDIQSVALEVAKGNLTTALYMSPAGPISAMDILFGYGPSLAKGQHYMAHRCGFTHAHLRSCLGAAGFGMIASLARPAPAFDLWALAYVGQPSEQDVRTAAAKFLPLHGA